MKLIFSRFKPVHFLTLTIICSSINIYIKHPPFKRESTKNFQSYHLNNRLSAINNSFDSVEMATSKSKAQYIDPIKRVQRLTNPIQSHGTVSAAQLCLQRSTKHRLYHSMKCSSFQHMRIKP